MFLPHRSPSSAASLGVGPASAFRETLMALGAAARPGRAPPRWRLSGESTSSPVPGGSPAISGRVAALPREHGTRPPGQRPVERGQTPTRPRARRDVSGGQARSRTAVTPRSSTDDRGRPARCARGDRPPAAIRNPSHLQQLGGVLGTGCTGQDPRVRSPSQIDLHVLGSLADGHEPGERRADGKGGHSLNPTLGRRSARLGADAGFRGLATAPSEARSTSSRSLAAYWNRRMTSRP